LADGVGPIFDALGDPGRRDLIQAISERGSATATELAADRDVTRQAVSKQLNALADAGLLRATRTGRETRYEVTPEPLGEAMAWIADVGGRWDARLDALREHLGRRRR
jgi:DNA-binding transcriptional ArsR family regulator